MLLADSSKQEHIEEFLRKSLLGEELVNTQFHLFSARSVSSTKSSKYFLELLGSDVNPSDGSLSDLTDANDVPGHVQIDNYGYGSDSDLDDDEEAPIPIADTSTDAPKDEFATVSTAPLKISVAIQPKDDDELSEDGSESVSSDMFVMSPEHPRTNEPFMTNVDRAGSLMSSEIIVQDTRVNETSTMNHAAVRLRSLGSRHVLVKDTAFQTWYTLLDYVYTGKFNFLPLGSATPGGQPHKSSTNSGDKPRCSAKSMYRLACKVGIDHLRDEALVHIRSSLTEHNILKELSCSLLSRYPQLLEMELDMLYTYIASPPVITGLPALAQHIAHKEIPHGADIIVGIHARILKERFPLPSIPTPSTLPLSPTFSSLAPPAPSEDYELQPQPVSEPLSHTIEYELTEPPPTSSGQWGCGFSPEPSPCLPPAAEDPCYTIENGFIEPEPVPASLGECGGGLGSGPFPGRGDFDLAEPGTSDLDVWGAKKKKSGGVDGSGGGKKKKKK
ncbi:hypothetical protein HD554DRAFT_2317104 [Boletus coccyginus]|nr:hypothetical protein HD554DRAFT_2317104 [Boletus coccyginus]